MASVSTIQQNYSVPKLMFMEQFFPLLIDKITGEVDEESVAPDYLLAVYASQYLLALEGVCKLYVDDRVDEQAKTSIKNQVVADVKGFLMYFYDEDEGTIGVSDSVMVPWLRRDGRESSSEYSLYPTTARCLMEIDIALKSESTSLWN